MNAVHRIFSNGVAIERVALLRATMNEAPEIYGNLIDDITDYNSIIVDLSFCNFIDSTFLGALIQAYRKMKLKGGSIVIILNNTFITKSILYNNIASIFKVYNSFKNALHELSNPYDKVRVDECKDISDRKHPDKIVQTHLQVIPKGKN